MEDNKRCTDCIHFRPPTDVKYNKIPEFSGGVDAYNFGQGYMANSRCNAVTSEATTPAIRGMKIPVLISQARFQNSECGPEGKLFEPKPAPLALTFIDNIIQTLTKILGSK